jgi:hypothetical protein
MKRTTFTEEQTAYVLRQANAGMRMSDVCGGPGLSQATPLRIDPGCA